MPPGVIGMFAVLGALTGLGVRPIVFALSGPTGHPARTDCPHCGTPVLTGCRRAIAVVSGRCRSCRSRLAVPPGLLEVLLAGVFALLAYRHANVLVVLAFCWLAGHGAAVSLIDLAVHRIPNVLAVSAYAGVTLLLATAALADHHLFGLLRAVLVGVALAAFYGVLALASRGGLGLGDVKLAASVGTALGWVGMPALVMGTLLGFVLGAVYGLVAIVTGRSGWHALFAFGPFMSLGAVVALLIG